jgi:hypothetical protein
MKLFCVIMLALLLLGGCSKDNGFVPEIQFTDSIMPLAVGNYWIYTDSTFVTHYPAFVDTTKIGITGYRNIKYDEEQITVYYWNWFNMPENVPQQRKNMVRNEEEGLIYYGQVVGSSVSPISRSLFIKYPVSVGEEWPYSSGYTLESISEAAPFTTPLGTFDCYVYLLVPPSRGGTGHADIISHFDIGGQRSDFEGLPRELYYVPEVGYVGMIIREEGQVVYRKTLVDYHVIQNEEIPRGMKHILAP